MDPNEMKKYPHQFMPQMLYGNNYKGYVQGNFPHVPGAQIPLMHMNPPTQPRIQPSYMETPQPQTSYAVTPQSDIGQQDKTKGKRRSKNDTVGRDYKCTQCDKNYLSYPALYTHIKTKHSVRGETPITSVRGRGRPKKSTNKDSHVDPTSIFYFHTEERKGGPTAVIYGFKEAFELVFAKSTTYKAYERHKLYIELYKRHLENVKACNYTKEHPGVTVFGLKPQGLPEAIYELKSEEQPVEEPAEARVNESSEEQVVDDKTREENQRRKKMKKCDEIFAEYLDLIAKDTNRKCYANVVMFVLLYRECMNQYGERVIRGNTNAEANLENAKEEESKDSYCLTNDAERVPEASNEFVTTYLEEAKITFGNMNPVDLTQNFCGWLFNGGYTCSKLSLMNEN